MEQFFDIYDFHYVPFWKTSPFFVIAIVISLCLLTLLIYKWIRFKDEKALTPWQTAEQEIRKLDPSFLETKTEFKKFYFGLTGILKSYLGKRYNLDLEDKTDDEVEIYLKDKNLDESLKKDLIEILHGSRFVKFAGEDALPSKAYKDWELALNIINRTIPQK